LDFKDFHDGLLSLSLLIFGLSLTLMIGTIVLKPYLGIQSQERDIIVILCAINIIFSLYYLKKVLTLQKIFKLETKNIIKYSKRIGIVTIVYIPHVLIMSTLFFRSLHNLEILMMSLIFFIEIMLIGLIFKEVYDIVFIEESQRDAEIEKNRKKYFET
jgi:hypothetical protein